MAFKNSIIYTVTEQPIFIEIIFSRILSVPERTSNLVSQTLVSISFVYGFFSRHIKKSFIYSIRGKDDNGRPKIVGEREVEIPTEFQLQASDVNEHCRRAILDQVGEKSYRDLCLETIEIARSKACSDWWKQYPESYWPIKKGFGSKFSHQHSQIVTNITVTLFYFKKKNN